MAQRSALQVFPSGLRARMKGKKASLAQRFVGRHTGRATLAGAAGEAKEAKKANGAREARMRSQLAQEALIGLP